MVAHIIFWNDILSFCNEVCRDNYVLDGYVQQLVDCSFQNDTGSDKSQVFSNVTGLVFTTSSAEEVKFRLHKLSLHLNQKEENSATIKTFMVRRGLLSL